MKDLLRHQIAKALRACFDNQTLHSENIPDIQIEIPGNPDHGDFATNIAMVMARAEKKAPRQIAEVSRSEDGPCNPLLTTTASVTHGAGGRQVPFALLLRWSRLDTGGDTRKEFNTAPSRLLPGARRRELTERIARGLFPRGDRRGGIAELTVRIKEYVDASRCPTD